MIDFQQEAVVLRGQLDAESAEKYASVMGVTPHALIQLGCGFARAGDLVRLKVGFGKGKRFDEALAIPESDAVGNVIGISMRAFDGTKGCATGSERGLVFSSPMGEATEPLLIVEGFGDLAAAYSLGLSGIARASCAVGTELLADVPGIFEHEIVVVADSDEVGMIGGKDLAIHLATKGGKPIRCASMAGPHKDVRAWVRAREIDFADETRCADARAQLLQNLSENAAEHQPRLLTVCFDDIEAKPLEWLLRGFLPRGKLCIVSGHPGVGKSYLTTDLAARLSRGQGMPGEHAPERPVDVLFLSAEDDPADTIKPRLEAAGADMHRVHSATSFDLRDLAKMIEERPEVALVVIDPLSAYLGNVNSHNDAEVRTFLMPFVELARLKNVSILFVSHLRKSGGGAAVTRPGGSIALVAAARVSWLLAKDPNDESRRLLVSIKNNLGKDNLGWAFTLYSEGDDAQPVLKFEDERVAKSAEEILGDDSTQPTDRRSRGQQAEEWLEEQLCDGPVPAKEIGDRAETAGFASRTLERAKRELGVMSKKATLGGGWMWMLPTEGRQVAEGSHPTPDARLGAFEECQLAAFEEDQERQGRQVFEAGGSGVLGGVEPSSNRPPAPAPDGQLFDSRNVYSEDPA